MGHGVGPDVAAASQGRGERSPGRVDTQVLGTFHCVCRVGWASWPAGEEAAGEPALPDGGAIACLVLLGGTQESPSAGIAVSARPVHRAREGRRPCPRPEHGSVSCSLARNTEQHSVEDSELRHRLRTYLSFPLRSPSVRARV